MNLSTLIRLELKRLLATPSIVGGLVIILVTGVQAINQGRSWLIDQQQHLASAVAIEKDHQSRMIRLHGSPDPRNALYYLNFFTRHEPGRFAAVSIGLRDINPFNLKIRLLSLEGQLYDSEISNPAARAIGNFDLSFLLVFLYPLLIIALTHNFIAEDRETGIWPMVRSQAVSVAQLIRIRLVLRVAIVMGAWLLTLTLATIRLDLPVDSRLLLTLLSSLLYLLFWFALSGSIALAEFSSNRLALILFSIWLTLTLVVPGAFNLMLNNRLPLTEAFEIVVRQREGYHRQWDGPKQETMQRFFESHPEYSHFQAPADRFSWGWYFAAQHIGDLEAASAAASLRQKMRQRQTWTERIGWMIPTINLQTTLNGVARTDLESHLAYLDSVREYHGRLRRHFYPALMREKSVSVDWPLVPTHHFGEESLPPGPTPAVLKLLGALSGLTLVALIHAWNRIRRLDRMVSRS